VKNLFVAISVELLVFSSIFLLGSFVIGMDADSLDSPLTAVMPIITCMLAFVGALTFTYRLCKKQKRQPCQKSDYSRGSNFQYLYT
jgi:hypothetical protein